MNVVGVSTQDAWVVDAIAALVLNAAGIPIMGAGVRVPLGKSLPVVAAYHLDLAIAKAGHHHHAGRHQLAVLVMNNRMESEISVGAGVEVQPHGLKRQNQLCFLV